MVQHTKINKCNTLYEEKEGQKHYNLNAEKNFDKIQQTFIIKTLSNLGIEGPPSILLMGIYEKPVANILLNGKMQKLSQNRS